MTMVDSLAISLPSLLAIFGAIIAWQNYKLNRRKANRAETKESEDKLKKEEEREKNNEIKLISIEKDVQYIRMMVEKFDNKIEDHEKRITKLESVKKGGK